MSDEIENQAPVQEATAKPKQARARKVTHPLAEYSGAAEQYLVQRRLTRAQAEARIQKFWSKPPEGRKLRKYGRNFRIGKGKNALVIGAKDAGEAIGLLHPNVWARLPDKARRASVYANTGDIIRSLRRLGLNYDPTPRASAKKAKAVSRKRTTPRKPRTPKVQTPQATPTPQVEETPAE